MSFAGEQTFVDAGAVADFAAAVAVLVADEDEPTQAHVNTLAAAWGCLLRNCLGSVMDVNDSIDQQPARCID
jgi:hypothetical protein